MYIKKKFFIKKKQLLIRLIKRIFINMLFNNNFILASSSKSRYNILKKNKLVFTKIKPDCDEDILKKKLIRKKSLIKNISLELARLKSKSISLKKKNCLIVGADTIIDFEGRVLNKANSLKQARIKIKNISGKSHYIYSSVSVYHNMREVWQTTEKSKVKIRKLSKEDIDEYLLKSGKDILSSVGCYQIEGVGPNIIEEIRGDFFNIMGFPLFPFLKFIKSYKIK